MPPPSPRLMSLASTAPSWVRPGHPNQPEGLIYVRLQNNLRRRKRQSISNVPTADMDALGAVKYLAQRRNSQSTTITERDGQCKAKGGLRRAKRILPDRQRDKPHVLLMAEGEKLDGMLPRRRDLRYTTPSYLSFDNGVEEQICGAKGCQLPSQDHLLDASNSIIQPDSTDKPHKVAEAWPPLQPFKQHLTSTTRSAVAPETAVQPSWANHYSQHPTLVTLLRGDKWLWAPLQLMHRINPSLLAQRLEVFEQNLVDFGDGKLSSLTACGSGCGYSLWRDGRCEIQDDEHTWCLLSETPRTNVELAKEIPRHTDWRENLDIQPSDHHNLRDAVPDIKLCSGGQGGNCPLDDLPSHAHRKSCCRKLGGKLKRSWRKYDLKASDVVRRLKGSFGSDETPVRRTE